MIVQELIATLGIEAEHGQFANVFALLDHVKEALEMVIGPFEKAFEKAWEAIEETAESATKFNREADKFGISAQSLQELAYAANMGDVGIDTLTNGMKFLSKSAVAAGEGGAEAMKAFAGIKTRDANGNLLQMEDLLENVAEKFATLPAGPEKTARAMAIFGRAGTDMLPFLNMGKEKIAEFRQEAERLGLVISEDMIKASERWEEESKRFSASLTGLRNAFAAPTIELVAELYERLSKVLATKGMARIVQFLSRAFYAVVDALNLAVDGLGWFLSNDTRVEFALFVVTSALVGMALAAGSAASSMIAAAASTIAAWVAAAAPFLLIGALIALIVDDLYTYFVGGDSLLGRFLDDIGKVNPEDHPLVQLFKRAADLVFDITDPAKWKRMGDAIRLMFADLAKAARDALPPAVWEVMVKGGRMMNNVMKPIADKVISTAQAATGMGDVPSNVNPIQRQHVLIQSPITITVPPGTDAHGVAQATRKAVHEVLTTVLTETLANQ